MAKKIAKENVVFDFDDIQQTFYTEKAYNPPEENPDIRRFLKTTLSWQKRFLGISSQSEVPQPRELVHRSRNLQRYRLIPFS